MTSHFSRAAAAAILTLGTAAFALAQPRPGAAPAAGSAQAPTGVTTFELRPSGVSRIAFTSDAPLETIEGVSTQTTGRFTVDLASPARQLSGTVQIPVASLGTGLAMRDEHLRGPSWLDGARSPNITLELVRTDLRALRPGRPVRGRVTGRLTLHGQTREITVPITARLIPLSATEHEGMQQVGIDANMLRIQGSFAISLRDYGVNIPAILRLKVADQITVRFDLTSFQAPSGSTVASATGR